MRPTGYREFAGKARDGGFRGSLSPGCASAFVNPFRGVPPAEEGATKRLKSPDITRLNHTKLVRCFDGFSWWRLLRLRARPRVSPAR